MTVTRPIHLKDILLGRYRDGFRPRARIMQVMALFCMLGTVIPLGLAAHPLIFWQKSDATLVARDQRIVGKNRSGSNDYAWGLHVRFKTAAGLEILSREETRNRRFAPSARVPQRIIVLYDPATPTRMITTEGIADYLDAAWAMAITGALLFGIGSLVWLLARREGATWQGRAAVAAT